MSSLCLVEAFFLLLLFFLFLFFSLSSSPLIMPWQRPLRVVNLGYVAEDLSSGAMPRAARSKEPAWPCFALPCLFSFDEAGCPLIRVMFCQSESQQVALFLLLK
ncbi:hypothetical protein LY76DRAFT_176588 [Colletotrichum caudatum]|nr:hypothetical protein LY76DRAFT_176588 [Colletotrichum caudatum]